MKVILSRKGMDSGSGGIPNLILPNKRLLSLPIPDEGSGLPYEKVSFGEKNLRELILEVSPRFGFEKKSKNCHLDPDIYDDLTTQTKRNPAFGQHEASAIHLDNHEVGVGDIFLFYGMFRETEMRADGRLRYKQKAPIRHIIYGYMKVGKKMDDLVEINRNYPNHPHANRKEYNNNRLYVPSEYGTFCYDARLVLTKEGQDKRSIWKLPSFFADNEITITWQSRGCCTRENGYTVMRSSYRGQEFVIEAQDAEHEKELYKWAEELIQIGKKGSEI